MLRSSSLYATPLHTQKRRFHGGPVIDNPPPKEPDKRELAVAPPILKSAQGNGNPLEQLYGGDEVCFILARCLGHLSTLLRRSLRRQGALAFSSATLGVRTRRNAVLAGLW